MSGVPDWVAPVEQGRGQVIVEQSVVRLVRSGATADLYSNAQISDRPGRDGWRPPLTLALRARFSHPVDQLRGTAGFGFWNDFLAPGRWGVRRPRAVWFFFGGPPHDVPLALDVPGGGFKAAVLDAGRLAFVALAPAAPLGFLLMRVPLLYRRLWPIAQRALGVAEASLSELDLTVPHAYALHWRQERATFAVDGRTVLVAPTAPAGPLRFVAWIDNAYAIATPRGRFRVGLIDAPESQSLELAALTLQPG